MVMNRCKCPPINICKCRPFSNPLLYPLEMLHRYLQEIELQRQMIYQKDVFSKDDETELIKIGFLIIKISVEIGLREAGDL